MRELPILFKPHLIVAIMEDRKFQTRRLGKCRWQPGDRLWCREPFWIGHDSDNFENQGPFDCGVSLTEDRHAPIQYVASPTNPECPNEPGDWYGPDDWFPQRMWLPWGHGRGFGPNFYSKRPGIHMPRWACRLTVEVTAVRYERLHEITEDDARAEGIAPIVTVRKVYPSAHADAVEHVSYREAFAVTWDKINGKRGPWASNPKVSVTTFKRVVQQPARAEAA